MNAKHIIAAAAALAAGASAFSQPRNTIGEDPLYPGEQQKISQPNTRAEVVAELKEAIAQGKLHSVGEMPTYPDDPMPMSTRSRAEVKGEARENPRSGDIFPE